MSQDSNDTRSADALLRSVRDAHAATRADRERVRRALARRLAESADMPAPAVTALHSAIAFASWLKLGLALAFAGAASLAIQRYSAVSKPAAISITPQLSTVSTEACAPGPSEGLDAVDAEDTDSAIPSNADPSTPRALTPPERGPLASAARTARASATRGASNRRVGNSRSALPAHADPLVQSESEQLPDDPSSSARAAEQAGDSRDPKIIASDSTHNTTRSADSGRATLQRAPHNRVHAQAETGLNATQDRSPAEPVNKETAAGPERKETATPLLAAERNANAVDATPTKNTPEEPVNAELAFLKRIQGALQAGELQEVIELSEAHERRWPQGTFVQERQGLRTIAACQAHIENAASNANKFAAEYPQSPMLSRVRNACTPPSAANASR